MCLRKVLSGSSIDEQLKSSSTYWEVGQSHITYCSCNVMYILCTEQTHSANSSSRDSLIAWITWIFQKQSCYSCCYGLSKQDVLGFSSSQQPGPPTQTVYLRLELNLCDYSLLTSYNHPGPPLPLPGQILAAPLGSSARVTHFPFSSISFNSFGLPFWESACTWQDP